MSEERKLARTFVVRYRCDECDEGFMQPSGGALLSSPPKYPHQCDSCGATKNMRKHYPVTVVEEVS